MSDKFVYEVIDETCAGARLGFYSSYEQAVRAMAKEIRALSRAVAEPTKFHFEIIKHRLDVPYKPT